jgi:hypothetical protein
VRGRVSVVGAVMLAGVAMVPALPGFALGAAIHPSRVSTHARPRLLCAHPATGVFTVPVRPKECDVQPKSSGPPLEGEPSSTPVRRMTRLRWSSWSHHRAAGSGVLRPKSHLPRTRYRIVLTRPIGTCIGDEAFGQFTELSYRSVAHPRRDSGKMRLATQGCHE